MRINYDYIKTMLDVFLDSSKPTVSIKNFALFNDNGEINDEIENQYVFHLKILVDQGLVSGAGSDPSKIGIIYKANGGYGFYAAQLRLTSTGHEFAANLNKPGIIEAIKKTFKDEGIGAVIDIAKDLGGKIIAKKLGLES